MHLLNQSSSRHCELVGCNTTHIRNARTEYDIIKALKEILPAYGLKTFLFSSFKFGDVTGESVQYGINNWQSEIYYRYCGNKHISQNPVLQRLRTKVVPQTMSQREIADAETDPSCREIHEALIEAGYEGIAFFPVRGSSGRTGAVQFAGDRSPLRECEMMQLGFLAQHAFESASTIMASMNNDRCLLSEREIECLRLIAEGLTTAEIGIELDITAHTVNYHIANFSKKLGARNKGHALAVAIRNGYISI